MDDSTSNAETPDSGTAGTPDAVREAPAGDTPGAETQGAMGSTPDGPAKKKTSPWVWVAIVAAIVLIAGAAIAASSSSDSGGILVLLFGGQKVTVPLVVGQPQADAESAIAEAGLLVGQITQEPTLDFPPGQVIAQSPEADTEVDEETAVDITVSAIPQVAVPELIGQEVSDASATLAEQGLQIGAVDYAYSTTAQPGSVTAQDPEPSTQVTVGSSVNVTVSKGQQQGQVPNVVGLSQGDAEATLESAGFAVTATKLTSADVPAGDVIAQSPAAGTVMTAGSAVTIQVSAGVPDAPKATVPDVVGLRYSEAFNALQNAGLKVNIQFVTSDEYVLKVAEQSPAAGTSVDPGTVVMISIGLPEFSLESTSTPDASPDATKTP